MRARVFYLLFLMIFVSCTTDDNRNYVEILVGQYKEFSPATPSEVYDVEPIYIQLPFRGGENSSFGSIEKVIVRNDILYIKDSSSKRLITRPVSGGAYSVLDYRGRGPNEYLQISDFDNYLVTAGIPDPDLIIRTSGEQRISNYLLWQGAYSEFYFTDVMWPDFRKEAYREALAEYARRDRRYGKVK